MAALSQMISLAVRGYVIEGELCSATCGKLERGRLFGVDVMRDIFCPPKTAVINSGTPISCFELSLFDFREVK